MPIKIKITYITFKMLKASHAILLTTLLFLLLTPSIAQRGGGGSRGGGGGGGSRSGGSYYGSRSSASVTNCVNACAGVPQCIDHCRRSSTAGTIVGSVIGGLCVGGIGISICATCHCCVPCQKRYRYWRLKRDYNRVDARGMSG